MTRTVTLLLESLTDVDVHGVRVTSLPDAVEIAASSPTEPCIFDLTSPPDVGWPLHEVQLPNVRLVTNRIAGLLGLIADRLILVSRADQISISSDWSAIPEAETAIYGAAAEAMGPSWLKVRAEVSRQARYVRQQRLELLHCIALRLCENPASAAFGRVIDRQISDMAMPPLKATSRPLVEHAVGAG